jgi:glycosyltransferase involved in cell wall biosynthesis
MINQPVPRVSVVIAVRNCEQYVALCIDSIKSHYFRSYEVVVVDDGSEDNTPDIAAEFERSHPDLSINVCRNPVRQGIGASRNHTLRLAVGEYIAVLDGDDLCRTDRLAKQAGFLDANPRCFCVGSTATSISHEGRGQGIVDLGVRSHEEIVEQFLAGCNPIINSSAMFRRREATELLGGYKTEGPAALVEDLDFWYRALLAGLRFEVLPDPLVFYRSNPAGHTQTRQHEIQPAREQVFADFRHQFEELHQRPGRQRDQRSSFANPESRGFHLNLFSEDGGN